MNPASKLTETEKVKKFNADKADKDVYAYCGDGSKVLLGQLGLEEVDFIAGFWRVQNVFTEKIVNVNGKEFVLCEKLANSGDFITFYNAKMVGVNAYGKFTFSKATHKIANSGLFWGYGESADQARAFLLSNAIKNPELNILKKIKNFSNQKR
jgi:hypothetical protein